MKSSGFITTLRSEKRHQYVIHMAASSVLSSASILSDRLGRVADADRREHQLRRAEEEDEEEAEQGAAAGEERLFGWPVVFSISSSFLRAARGA